MMRIDCEAIQTSKFDVASPPLTPKDTNHGDKYPNHTTTDFDVWDKQISDFTSNQFVDRKESPSAQEFNSSSSGNYSKIKRNVGQHNHNLNPERFKKFITKDNLVGETAMKNAN